MFRDPRGGHNRKRINEDFFKSWSPAMAYVLGLIFADGAIEDVRLSSRTCYLHIASKDRPFLEQVRKVLSSEHNIYRRMPGKISIKGKEYIRKDVYSLRIGSKIIYQDLINLGLTPRKSLKMKLPEIPKEHFRFFLRGYFDGDGNISCYIPKGRKIPRIRLTFVSGSHEFLDTLARKIQSTLNTKSKTLYKERGGNAYYLKYSKKDGLKIFDNMYKNLNRAPYLSRKYNIYQFFLSQN